MGKRKPSQVGGRSRHLGLARMRADKIERRTGESREEEIPEPSTVRITPRHFPIQINTESLYNLHILPTRGTLNQSKNLSTKAKDKGEKAEIVR